MLNYDLARTRGLCKDQVKDLEMLHECMTAMVYMHNDNCEESPYTKKERKKLRKTVRRVEYTMQVIWGFDTDKTRHYHWSRFRALNNDLVQWVSSS
jgi:hypothetical protein